MNGLKKLHLLLLPVLFSSVITQVADASALSPSARARGGWYVELEGFNAKVQDSLLSTLPFATSSLFISEGSFSNTQDINYFFQHDFDWGYRAAVGYDFPSCTCCNYGFSLEYTWYRTDDRRNVGGLIDDEGNPSLEPFTSTFGVDATDVNAKYDFRYETFDILGHQNRTFCNCVDVQFYAGARFLRLKERQHSHFFVSPDLVDAVFEEDNSVDEDFIDIHSKFEGVGPRVGINLLYNLSCNFGLVADLGTNLIFGLSDSDYSERFTSLDLIGEGQFVVDTGSSDSHPSRSCLIVPSLSGKVGLAYHTRLCNCSSLGVEVGYRGDKYFNIANHSTYVLLEEDPAFIKSGIYHDFDIAGPYVSVTYHM